MSSKKQKNDFQQEAGLSKRELEKQKENKKRQKTKKLAIIVVAVVVVLTLLAVLINSKFIRRHGTAYEVAGKEFTAAEFDFHFCNYYYEYAEYVYTNQPDYATMLLPSSVYMPTQLGAEEYYDGVTWKEHFQEYCETSLARDIALYNEGKSVGFEQTEEQKASLAEELDSMEESAISAGYANADKYVSNYYGASCTMDIVREQMAWLSYASDYEDYYKSTLTYPDEVLAATYEENKDLFDFFNYRYFVVYSDDVDESLYETDEELDAAKQAVAAEAHARAEEYVIGIKSEADFIAAARQEDEENYAEDDSTLRSYDGELLGGTYGPWLREAGREYGDVTAIDMTVGTYVVMYLNRSVSDYNTADIRVIFMTPQAVNEADYEDDEDDAAYNEAVELMKDVCKSEAEGVYNDWKENGETEDYFAELADQNSETSKKDGGLVQYVYHGQYSDELNDWIFDESRKSGDSAIIWSESAGGYYILYYSGENMQYNYYKAQEKLYNNDYNDWNNNLTEGVSGKRTWMFALT